jgi:hypothetical protein
MSNTPRFPQFPIRIDPSLIAKIRYIGAENCRSTSKEIEFLIINRIKQYELENGEITDDDLKRFFDKL